MLSCDLFAHPASRRRGIGMLQTGCFERHYPRKTGKAYGHEEQIVDVDARARASAIRSR